MDRYVVRADMMVVIDTEGSTYEEVSANFYARLSELVPSEDHMLDCNVEAFDLPKAPSQPEPIEER